MYEDHTFLGLCICQFEPPHFPHSPTPDSSCRRKNLGHQPLDQAVRAENNYNSGFSLPGNQRGRNPVVGPGSRRLLPKYSWFYFIIRKLCGAWSLTRWYLLHPGCDNILSWFHYNKITTNSSQTGTGAVILQDNSVCDSLTDVGTLHGPSTCYYWTQREEQMTVTGNQDPGLELMVMWWWVGGTRKVSIFINGDGDGDIFINRGGLHLRILSYRLRLTNMVWLDTIFTGIINTIIQQT